MEHIKPLQSILPSLIDYLCNPPASIKISGFPKFTEFTGGFRAKEFSILCGSTGSGKTSLLANWSAELLHNQTKHLVMSVETGHLDYLTRVLSVLANEDLNTGDPISKEKLTAIGIKQHENLFNGLIEFSLYDDRVPLANLMRDLAWAVENKCEIVFIDNLNFFMETTNDANWVQEMDRVTHELIIFCKRNPIHIVMVMHPKKADKGSTRVSSEFDIKGSSTAVQEASNIFLWNRPEQLKIEDGSFAFTDRELLIAKLRRRGRYAGRILVYDGEKPRYREKGSLYDITRDKPINNKSIGTTKRAPLHYKD